ncbi:MAG: hypothetical protein HQM10_21125 [Candidatus Riflebacteria bacterium]|nr:hypothetical protein [Candidatus Riflebacteria bacterium]
MELLLTICILAIISAVAVPQFFHSANKTVDTARMSQFKSKYFSIKSAIRQQIQFETDKTHIQLPDKLESATDNDITDANSRISMLIKNGYLHPDSARTEDASGGWINFKIITSISANLPPILAITEKYHVSISGVNIDSEIESGATWDSIWNNIR